MRIVFLGQADNANACARTARAINRIGGEMTARVIVAFAHPYGYREDIVLSAETHEEASAVLHMADWVIGTGDSDYKAFFSLLGKLRGTRRGCRFATHHAGSRYRADPLSYRRLDVQEWGALGGKRFDRWFMSYSLLRYVTDAPQACVHTQPPDVIAESIDIPSHGPVRVCHAPSKRSVKGSDRIGQAVDGIAGVAYGEIHGLPHAQCVATMAKHDILVDQLNPEIGGWGAATNEALGLGLVVVSDVRNVTLGVERWLGRLPPIHAAFSAQRIRREVEWFADMSANHLLDAREQSLRWARLHLSDEHTYGHWARCLAFDD